MKTEHRIESLDVIKAISILMVVVYHTTVILPTTDMLYIIPINTLIAMSLPMMLIVHGMLLFSKPFHLSSHIKKISRLLILTLGWCFFTELILQMIHGEINLFRCIQYTVYRVHRHYNDHLWYLQNLCILYIFFPLLKLAWDTDKKIYKMFYKISWFIVYLNPVLNEGIQSLYMIFHKTLFHHGTTYNLFQGFDFLSGFNDWTIIYFMTGPLLLELKNEPTLFFSCNRAGIILNSLSDILKKWGALILWIGAFLYWCFYSWGREIYSGTVFDGTWYGLETLPIFIMSVIFSLQLFSFHPRHLKKSWSFLARIGQDSMGIYLLHRFLIYICGTSLIEQGISINRIVCFIIGVLITLICAVLYQFCIKIPYVKEAFRM